MGGIDKGWAEHQGRPLIESVVERFRPQVDVLMISANRNIEQYARFGTVVTDLDAGQSAEAFPGPLVGLLAGLRSARTAWMAVVPCDAPQLPLDLVATLLRNAASAAAPAAVACVDAQLQPVFAIVATQMTAALENSVAQGERALHRWLRSIDALVVEFADAAGFRNVNALESRPG